MGISRTVRRGLSSAFNAISRSKSSAARRSPHNAAEEKESRNPLTRLANRFASKSHLNKGKGSEDLSRHEASSRSISHDTSAKATEKTDAKSSEKPKKQKVTFDEEVTVTYTPGVLRNIKRNGSSVSVFITNKSDPAQPFPPDSTDEALGTSVEALESNVLPMGSNMARLRHADSISDVGKNVAKKAKTQNPKEVISSSEELVANEDESSELVASEDESSAL